MRRQIRDGTVTLRVNTIRKGGKTYVYTRIKGEKPVRLPALPLDHPDFLAAYAAAIAGAPTQPRAKKGTIQHMIDAYMLSDAFTKGLSKDYRYTIRRHLAAIREQAGDARIADLRKKHIQADLTPLAPYVAAARLKAWRLLCLFGVGADGMLTTNPSEGIVRKAIPKTDGHLPWSRDHVDAYRGRWPLDTIQRRAFELVYWTGARIGDAIRLGEGMVGRDGVLAFRQAKTGAEAFVPWTCQLPEYAAHLAGDRDLLHATLSARTERHMTILATAYGKSRSVGGLGNMVGEAARAAGVDRSAHGLRKSRLTELADGGASTHALQAWGGHLTLAEVQHYTDSANRRKAVTGTERDRNSANRSAHAANSAENA